MPKSDTTVVFDADDTLWMNEWQYSEAYAVFFAYLYEVLRDLTPNLHQVRDRFFQIDHALYETYGIRRGRVAEAMVRTYTEICEWIEARFGEHVYSSAHVEHIRRIGDMPFNFTELRFLPDVEDVLDMLRDEGAHLRLLTSYDPDVFPDKARYLRLDRWFSPEDIRAIPHKKTVEDFVAVSGWAAGPAAHERRWFAVGNGESDILPAVGMADHWHGVYIPHGSTSAFFKSHASADRFTPPALDHPRVTTVRAFGDVLGII